MRIREDGGKRVKIKGLDIRGTAASELQKQKRRKEGGKESRVERAEEEAYGSESVEKILIQFEAEEGKRVFLGLTRELQGLSSW